MIGCKVKYCADRPSGLRTGNSDTATRRAAAEQRMCAFEKMELASRLSTSVTGGD